MKRVVWSKETHWDAVLRQGEREEVVVMRGGHAVALLTPFDDDDMRWYARETDPAFLESIAVARREVREGKTIGHADLKRELGIDPEGDEMSLDRVLDVLDRIHQRATYSAVTGVIGGSPRTVMKGRPLDPRHSWVVARKTGQPTGYSEAQKHKLVREKHGEVIADPEQLRRLLESSR